MQGQLYQFEYLFVCYFVIVLTNQALGNATNCFVFNCFCFFILCRQIASWRVVGLSFIAICALQVLFSPILHGPTFPLCLRLISAEMATTDSCCSCAICIFNHLTDYGQSCSTIVVEIKCWIASDFKSVVSFVFHRFRCCVECLLEYHLIYCLSFLRINNY